MGENIDYSQLVSRTPPEGLVQWVLAQGELKKEYLIYKAGKVYDPLEKRNREAVEVRCTACQRSFLAEKLQNNACHTAYYAAPFGFRHPETLEPLISGRSTLCPICGEETEAVHVGQIRHGRKEVTYVAAPGRVQVPGKTDRFVLTDWVVTRFINKEGQSRFGTHPWTAWVVEERKVIRLMGYQKYMSTLSYIDLEQRKTFLDDFGKSKLVWPTKPEHLIGTTAENSKLDRYIAQGGECLVAYLAMWRKKPAAENLVMQGYGKLVDELIDTENTTGTYSRHKGIPKLTELDWTAKQPHRMLRLTKEDFRAFRGKLNKKDYHLLVWARKEENPAKLPEDMELLRHLGEYGCKNLLEMVGRAGFMRAARYLYKQKMSCSILRDYRRDAATAGWDMADPGILWPTNLKAAHDRAAEAARVRVEKESEAMFRQRYESLSRFAARMDGILIRPCQSQTELTNEGKILHHCVAGYAKSVVTGATAIFFVRREEKPDEPWYTLELDEKNFRVKQNRGMKNCGRTEDVIAFEDKWVRWLKAGAKRDKDGLPIVPAENQQKERKTA